MAGKHNDGGQWYFISGFECNFSSEYQQGRKRPFNPAYADTWKVAGNELTWAVRHATVTFTALAEADGVIVIGYKLNDSFDLSAQGGRSGAYNTVSSGAGFLYHNVAGGNISLQVNAWWDATIK